MFITTNCANWCSCFGSWMQWLRLILQVNNRVVDFIASWCHFVINFMDVDLTDVFRTKQHCSMPKTVPIVWGILKLWTVKHIGLVFWPTLRLPKFIYLFYLISQTKDPQRIQLKAGVIAADLTCGPFPGPGSSSERRASMNPMHEFIHHDDGHVEDAFHRFKKAHNKNYRDKATHEKRKQNFRHNLRLVPLQWLMLFSSQF